MIIVGAAGSDETGAGPERQAVGGMTGAGGRKGAGEGTADEEEGEEGWAWGGGVVHEGAGGYGGSVSCGVGKKSRIIGGTVAKPEEFPWQVVFRWESNIGRTGVECGGSLIDKKWVVSAGHCFENGPLPPPNELKVVLGEFDVWNEQGNEVVIAVKNVRRKCI